MSAPQRIPRVLEKFYSVRELSYLLGFNEKWWRERAQAGDLVLMDSAGNVVSEPVNLGGELRIPASAVNGYLARHPYRYDAGVAARNRAELRRKVAAQEQQQKEAA